MSLSRRSFAALFLGSAASGLALLEASSALADGVPGDAKADRHPSPPNTGISGKGDVRRALTPDDDAYRQKCVRWTMDGPTGKTWSWRNPKTGTRGTMKPTTKPERAAGRSCREFTETITLKDGRSETINGRACQKADGSWEVMA